LTILFDILPSVSFANGVGASWEQPEEAKPKSIIDAAAVAASLLRV
jgi:hypothetical protein